MMNLFNLVCQLHSPLCLSGLIYVSASWDDSDPGGSQNDFSEGGKLYPLALEMRKELIEDSNVSAASLEDNSVSGQALY